MKRSLVVTTGLVFVAALTVSAITWNSLRKIESAGHEQETARNIELSLNNIEKRLWHVRGWLEGAKALFAASKSVEREEWSAYVARIIGDDAHSSHVIDMRFVERVNANRLDRFKEELGKDSDFEVRTFSGERGRSKQEYYLIKFIEPTLTYGSQVGIEVSASLIRREALEISAETGDLAITGPLPAEEMDGHADRVAMYLPVYRNGTIQSNSFERREALQGWVAALVSVSQLMNPLPGESKDYINLSIHDSGKLLFDEQGELSKSEDRNLGEITRKFTWGKREWTLVFTPIRSAQHNFFSPIVFVFGLVISVLLAAFVWVLLGTRQRAESIAERALKSLAVAKDHNEMLIREAGSIIITLTSDGCVEGWNQAAARFHRATRNEAFGKNYCSSFVQERDRVRFASYLTRVSSGEPKHIECGIDCGDGRLRYVAWDFSKQTDLQLGNIRVMAVGQDISERVQLEDNLREKANTLSAITDSAQDAILMMNENGQISFWNPGAEKILGWSRDEALGRNLHDFLAPVRYHAAHLQAFPLFQATGQGAAVNKTLELFSLRKDGTEVPVELSLSAMQHGKKWVAVGVLRDITLRKQVEQALKDSEDYMRLVVNASRDANITTDINGVITFYNATAKRIFQWDAKEVFNLKIEKLFEEQGFNKYFSRWQDVPKNEPIVVTISAKRKDGSNFQAEVSVVQGEHRDKPFLLWVVADVNMLRILEAQQRQAHRIEAIGTLAAGIAHEINTPAQYVNDNLTFLKDSSEQLMGLLDACAELKSAESESPQKKTLAITKICELSKTLDLVFLGSEIPAALSESLVGIGRIAEIVRAMKAFAHPGSAEKKPIDLSKAIRDTVTVARNEWKYNAELDMQFDAALPPVPCLAGEFNQVVLNLIINATHAIADSLKNNPKRKGKIVINTAKEGNWAVVRVSDSGTGIPEHVRDRIFDPFFTTKEIGKGTGQGLAIAHAVIVDKHGGKITFETELGKGTTFIIHLPLVVPAVDTIELEASHA